MFFSLQDYTKRNGIKFGNCFCFLKHQAIRTVNRNRFGFSIRKLFGRKKLPYVRICNTKTYLKHLFFIVMEINVLLRLQCMYESPDGSLISGVPNTGIQ